MTSFFIAGPDLIHWQLRAVEQGGQFRLSIRHGRGVIVEYFTDAAAALLRERELEELLMAARTDGHAVPVRGSL
jgi:hypothetical protein